MGGPPDVWGIELHDHSVILGKSTGKVMIQHPVSLAQKATVSLPKPIAEEFQERVENCKTVISTTICSCEFLKHSR